ncbi:MAG TPA: ABC transporter permease subunit [Terriglobales bacterium]|nr:ABC transporter permease subunit [Terriglobales bacterium]
MDARNIRVIAGQEMRVTLRSKWVQIFAAVFAVLTLAISYFGMMTSVVVGFEGFTRTTASLLNLVLYLIPMFALVAGTLSFSIEKGAAELLFSQPVLRSEVLFGKILGLFSSLATAVVFGFGVSGFVIALQTGFEGISRYLGFVGLTLLLLLTFLCLGALASVISEGRARALGIALAMWFVFVLFYDLIALGIALLVNPHLSHTVILLSLFGNPVDLARVSGLLILGGATIFGAGGASLVRTFGSQALAVAVLSSVALLWSVLVLTAAGRFLANREI